jgi:hypothetical protein
MPLPDPLPPNDDDDISVVVQTTLGLIRLGRRAAGPSRGETDDVLPPASTVLKDHS